MICRQTYRLVYTHLHVALTDEGLVALGALVRLLAGVDASVDVQRTRVRERLVAVLALNNNNNLINNNDYNN